MTFLRAKWEKRPTILRLSIGALQDGGGFGMAETTKVTADASLKKSTGARMGKDTASAVLKVCWGVRLQPLRVAV